MSGMEIFAWTIATLSALTVLAATATTIRTRRVLRERLDAAQFLYEGQQVTIWSEGYNAGVYDQSVAAEYNAGAPFEQHGPARVNPYTVKAEAAR